MPKSSPSASPVSKAAQDESTAARKKKNAEAQAAFRARRANYIATLEESVTSLESVVLALQEAGREARAEVQDLQQQNARLRLEFQERERHWRVLWRSRKPGDDMPPLPPSSSTILPQPNAAGVPVGQSQFQYPEEHLNYRSDDSCPTVFNSSEHSYTGSPAIPLAEPNANDSKFSQYTYPVHASPRDPRWQLQSLPATGADATHQASQSPPVYLESPSLTASEMSFPSRSFGAPEEQKVALQSVLETAPYSFSGEDRYSNQLANPLPASRSLSPSSTPTSSSSTITPSFQYNFSDTMCQGNDPRNFDYRRHSLPHGEVTLHGGTADVSSLSGLPSDAVRYRLSSRKMEPGTEQQRSTPLVGTSACPLGGLGENGSSSHHDRAGSDSDALSLTSRLRRRRGTHTASRSPSPGPPSISCTVAVIKAQAFGALRRPRARGKKSQEGAAKVAQDVLEARGIGIGILTNSKRPRVDNETLPMET